MWAWRTLIAVQLCFLIYLGMRIDDNTHKSFMYLDDIYHKHYPGTGTPDAANYEKYWHRGVGWFAH